MSRPGSPAAARASSASTTRERQLATARALQGEFGLEFPLIHGNAETVPLPDASFDFAISEYGASIWADPYRWIPEAARLLRPGGELVFLVNGTILMLTVPEQDGLPATERCCARTSGFTASSGPTATRSTSTSATATGSASSGRTASRSRTSSSSGRPPTRRPATTTSSTLEWARQWPSEEIWKARKRG